MRVTIDKLVERVGVFTETNKANGGIKDVLEIKAIYFGDPGIIPVSNFPCMTVEPDLKSPSGENTGMDKRSLDIVIGIHIDAREYYDQDADEATGDRMLVDATEALEAWFRGRDERQLQGTVQDVAFAGTSYQPIRRGTTVISKSSRTNFVVRKNYMRQP